MTAPVTAKYEELVLEVETTTPGTYAKLCGLMGFTVTRAAQVDTSEVPADCDDESLPYTVNKQVRSLDFQISNASATWAQTSHEMIMAWFYSGATKNVRIQHVRAAVGDTEYESGAALLTQLDHVRTKGQKVMATISLQFDGTPTRTDKASS